MFENKIYKDEIKVFYDKLLNNEKFSLSRYGDGEWAAILENPLVCGNNPSKQIYEWTTTGDNSNYKNARNYLQKAIKYKADNYYLGICPCYKKMLEYSGQEKENLTYANIFVNYNYSFFVDNYIELFNNREVHLVANKESILYKLPFKVEKFYPVDYNAWVNNLYLIEEIKNKDYSDKLFLFCAGPLSNILCYKLWDTNKNNTYLDIGSVLDPWLQTGNPRGYYLGVESYSKLLCPCPNSN